VGNDAYEALDFYAFRIDMMQTCLCIMTDFYPFVTCQYGLRGEAYSGLPTHSTGCSPLLGAENLFNAD
jgi:hypothetical protein